MSQVVRMRGWFAAQEILRLAALVAIAAFLADWASKSWALETLTHGSSTLGAFLLAPAHNDAFAFSAGRDVVTTNLVLGARLCALLGLGVLFGRLVVRDRRSAMGFGMILGGGFGNTADLAFRGAVVDFINVGPYPFDWAGEAMKVHFVFNGADVAILIGIALLAPRIRESALQLQQRIGRWEARYVN